MFTSLRLERFKNFKDAELKPGPFTVLIGANASGKSNIRDAFRFLHGVARGYSLAEIIGEKYGEGGERVWGGIRGGGREIVFSGERSFILTSQSDIPRDLERLPRGPEFAGKDLRYRIETEIRRSNSIPRIASENLEIIDKYSLLSYFPHISAAFPPNFPPHNHVIVSRQSIAL
jgi:predicted ATPase